MRVVLAVALVLFGAPAAEAAVAQPPPGSDIAAAVEHAHLDRSALSFDVHPDLTYVETIEADYTLLTSHGIEERERSAMTFYPKTQSLDVVEAWVTEPDGSRITVEPAQIFTRPSAASENAPGFTGSMTTSVLYPQLREGSRTHIVWRLTQLQPSILGLNVWSEPALEWATTLGTVDITAPADVPLQWRVRGGYTASDTVVDGVRHISARIENTTGEEPERNMVDTSDFQPLFLATSLPNLQAIGAIYHRESAGRASVTPEIATLAAQIVGDKQGRAAAEAIYDWVAGNIRYVAVYLDPNDGWIPHPAADVLHNGFGDCKDHVELMEALLAARGIRGETGIIDWGTHTVDLPLWLPGQFNHVIVYLPDFDIYANPTNPYARFETLDRRLSGKTVVIATEQGEVRRTPDTRPADNLYRIDSRVTLGTDGTIEGTARMTMSPNMDSMIRNSLASASSPRDFAERVLAYSPEGGFGDFHSSNPRDLSGPLDLVATWRSPHGITFQGQDASIPVPTGLDLAPALRLRRYLSPSGQRRHAILAGAGDFTWSTTIRTAPDQHVTSLPPDISLTNHAGSYVATYTRTPEGVRVERHLVIDHDVVQAEDYPDLQALLYAPLDDARAVLVLTRTQTASN